MAKRNKKETFIYWLLWMSPCSFHRSKALVSHWNEIRESQFSSRKMKPLKNLPGVLPHSNSICSLPLGLQTLFPQISAKHLKEVTHWWVGHYRQQVVQMKTMLSTQFPKHRNSHLHLLQVHGAILLLRLCEISFLRYQHGITWVGLKLMDQQTWECEFFLESQCILGMSRKLRHPCTFHSLYPSSPAT